MLGTPLAGREGRRPLAVFDVDLVRGKGIDDAGIEAATLPHLVGAAVRVVEAGCRTASGVTEWPRRPAGGGSGRPASRPGSSVPTKEGADKPLRS